MNPILLIISREFFTRVRKRSFIVMTILGPLFFAATIFVPVWLAQRSGDDKTILVFSQSSIMQNNLVNDEEITYVFKNESCENAKTYLLDETYYGVLCIPNFTIDQPNGFIFYSNSSPSLSVLGKMKDQIQRNIENKKLLHYGLDQATLNGLKTNIEIATINFTSDGQEKSSNSGAAFLVGYVASFMIYMFIFLYGSMSMRGVIEEKSNRIIEVMISSVKPFHLMMGKIIGIAGVGLAQYLLWVSLSVSIMVTTKKFMPEIEAFMPILQTINIPLILFSFLFYFMGGYLLYGALFAAVGSAVESDADAQQFILPITVPLIISIITLSSVVSDPNGQLAFWLSIIPLSSPIIMMSRIPYGVPIWELALSMGLLVVGFIFTTWLASRIYRVGILMHGTKVNYKILVKWFLSKN